MADGTTTGLFIPTTQVWDIGQLYDTKVTDPAFKELLVRLYQYIGTIATTVNLKESAYYDKTEFACGQQFFPDSTNTSTSQGSPRYRQVYRYVVDFGALPNTATKNVAHGLAVNAGWIFTRIYGAASDPAGNYIPLPFASSTAANNIELKVDGTNVVVITGANRTAFTKTFVILEYIK